MKRLQLAAALATVLLVGGAASAGPPPAVKGFATGEYYPGGEVPYPYKTNTFDSTKFDSGALGQSKWSQHKHNWKLPPYTPAPRPFPGPTPGPLMKSSRR
jgi:hypothetical protein